MNPKEMRYRCGQASSMVDRIRWAQDMAAGMQLARENTGKPIDVLGFDSALKLGS